MKIPLRTSVLRTYRRRLTNLSSRNRSLLLTSLPAGQFLDLHETDFLLNKPSFTLIADLISRKPSVSLCEVLDARQERSNEVSRKLRRIDRTARFIEEERGTEDLYVGWPFVRGKFLDDTVVHGPLLFFPVQIEQQGKYWKLTRRGDELAFLNPTLALAYGQFNQVKLPDDVVEKTMDDLDRDPMVFRTQLYEWLKRTALEINFNPDLFTDKLQFFNKQTGKDLVQLEHTGELKLYPEAVLGIFPQAGSFLVPDYDALIGREEKEEEDGLDFPSLSPLSFPASFLPEKSIHTPLPMDASQEAAVRAVKAGQSLVVQGPPGTGKSQLIANLMADAAASGKRVLLVCQKRAALDVVQERLRQVGMAPFLALIHDFQDDRRALYAQIAEQINQLDAYRQQNNSLNAVLLERDFEVESRRIDDTVGELQAFKNSLFNTTEWGLSAKEIYLTCDSDSPILPLEDVYRQFNLAETDDFVSRLANYAAYQQRVGVNHLWTARISFAAFTNADLGRIDQLILRWTEMRQTANNQTFKLIGAPLSLDKLANWAANDWAINAVITLLNADEPDTPAVWTVINQLRNKPNHSALAIAETKLDQLADAWEETLVIPGPEMSLPTTDLRSFRDLMDGALTARSSWVQWTWWKLSNPGKAQLEQVSMANGLTITKEDLQRLMGKVNQRIKQEAIRHEAKPLLADLTLPESPEGMRLLRRARHLTERINNLEPFCQLPVSIWKKNQLDFVNCISASLNLAITVSRLQTEVETYLTTNQLVKLWEENDLVIPFRQALRNDFDLMIEADRLEERFSAAEKTIIQRLANEAPDTWAEVVQKSIRRAWLDHLETVYPELRSVSSLKMAQWEQVLQDSVIRKQMLSRDILLVKLREQTYRNLTLNRLNNVVTYRDLLHQTTKKRNVWPVRKLMESYADELFKLVPCWLASPESVSAMFPLREGLFDLVIFDEASQCFSENGIPAMARGNQVVVTGDNQQLRPSDLYRTRLDDAEPDEVILAALEVESLLELAGQYLPQLSLTEHYRSRSLDLIMFSNKHFYQNKLSLLPHFDEINRNEPAIRYHNVKGVWQQNTNPAEAEAVLQLLEQISAELPGRSVGIVTFNYPQQQLIQDMLESRVNIVLAESTQGLSPGLFVKNIENVQGDERDVIIFSVGYAADERGRLSMQFGSLNSRGGENRLNVAVTRARERVYVVTSLWPEQLNVADTVNEGPKLLKDYLTYALSVAQEQFNPLPQSQQGLNATTLLKNKLAVKHLNWQPELPFADLTVKSGETYESLILTDDDAYYQQTIKQAQAYLPIALRARKWPFKRIWSRGFWRNEV